MSLLGFIGMVFFLGLGTIHMDRNLNAVRLLGLHER
jgi:hypothetical protein